MIFLILLTALSTMVFADDCATCVQELRPFDAVVKNIETLQAPTIIDCKETLKNSAKEEYLNLFAKLPKQEKQIKGLKLVGSADELKYLNKMLSDKPTDRWSKAKGCITVLCAVTKLYDSEETAHRVLNLAKRDGYIVSASKDFNMESGPIGQLFTPKEIRDIDLAYKMLPAPYKKLRSLDRLKRMPNGYSSPRSPNAAAYASPGYHSAYYNDEGEITFLDGAFSSDESWAPMVAVHELSHHVDFSNSSKSSFGISEGSTYLQLSGWKKKKTYEVDKKTGKKTEVTQWQHRENKKFVTDYASTQPAEDFAESAAYYVFHPEVLKAIDPEKYDFIKNNVFKGKEYSSQVKLPISPKEILRICIDAKKKYSLYGNANYFSEQLSSSCLNEYIKDFKITDPELCALNNAQIKNTFFDSISTSRLYLNEVMKKCETSSPETEIECMKDGDYQKDCPIRKYFSKNSLSPNQLNLSEQETMQLQEKLISKIDYYSFGNKDKKVMNSIISNMGKNNFISEILINGLSDKGRIHDQFSLTRQGDFLRNANEGLSQKLKKDGYKFDNEKSFEQISQYYLMTEKEITDPINNFQENVLKKATKSKEKNLELIKTWATTQSLEETPSFADLAESLRKYGGIKFGWN